MTSDHEVDWLKITECFDRHGVEYLIVGGVGAQIHGATRPTSDFDSLPDTSEENLDRLAAALHGLGAYLRVEGLSDEEARALPVHLDGETLVRMDISTWSTDAGDVDVLTALPTREGGRSRYEDLVVRPAPSTLVASPFVSQRSMTSSPRRSGRTAPRTEPLSMSCTGWQPTSPERSR